MTTRTATRTPSFCSTSTTSGGRRAVRGRPLIPPRPLMRPMRETPGRPSGQPPVPKNAAGKRLEKKDVRDGGGKRSLRNLFKDNSLGNRDIPGRDAGYPPCRRFRSYYRMLSGKGYCYPPCRRFRRNDGPVIPPGDRYPPCRRFRRLNPAAIAALRGYPPCRRFRRRHRAGCGDGFGYPPCRRLRRYAQ